MHKSASPLLRCVRYFVARFARHELIFEAGVIGEQLEIIRQNALDFSVFDVGIRVAGGVAHDR